MRNVHGGLRPQIAPAAWGQLDFADVPRGLGQRPREPWVVKRRPGKVSPESSMFVAPSSV